MAGQGRNGQWLGWLVLCGLLLAACAKPPTPMQRTAATAAQLAEHGWQAFDIPAGAFVIRGFAPARQEKKQHLVLYIEGDGFAWRTSTQPSDDPTPIDPIALRLAMAQPGGAVCALARPCQYVGAGSRTCPEKYWLEARFAPEVITAMNQAVDAVKARYGAQHLTLVGFSGGAAVAALIAAERSDVRRLFTVAGNLDPAAWTRIHHLTALTGSLNPAAHCGNLPRTQQFHLVGGRDETVPAEVVQSFLKACGGSQPYSLKIVPEFDHHCCWVDHWPTLWQDITGQHPSPLP